MEDLVVAASGPGAGLPAYVADPRPGGRRQRSGRERLVLTGVILLALLPVAGVAVYAAVFILGQLGSGAAGGCGGG